VGGRGGRGRGSHKDFWKADTISMEEVPAVNSGVAVSFAEAVNDKATKTKGCKGMRA